jgi:hypothetical protein
MYNAKDGAFDNFYLATEVVCSHRSSEELTQEICAKIGVMSVIVSYTATDSSL